MIDPLTSLGLAANVIQLVQFGYKVLDTGYELAKRGTTPENEHIKLLTIEIAKICKDLNAQLPPPVDDTAPPKWVNPRDKDLLPEWREPESESTKDERKKDEEVRKLADRTQTAAKELSKMLSHLNLNDGQEEDGKPVKRRKRQVARGIWDGIFSHKHLQEMTAELKDLQQCMILRLSATQSISAKAMLDSLNEFSRNIKTERKERMAVYRQILDRLEKPENSCTVPSSISNFIANTSDQVRASLVCHRVLKTLVFEEVHSRENTIAEAHTKTFEWIYDRDTTDFCEWASMKNGMFWITGKPGSGKSTLMKYLVQQAHTQKLLRQWAGADELVVAHHYFWNAGTTMQKSQLGLLQTLVLHIIHQVPQSAVHCLPARFLDIEHRQHVPWTKTELYETIRTFGQLEGGGVKFCFFIDGLDEYTGDFTSLIDLISSLATSSQIKICVSSRPWNVFTRAYHERTDGQLEVQGLTKDDIRTYVDDKMSADDRFKKLRKEDETSCLKLIDDITIKAQGVFLWVYLVVHSLLRGLTNDDGLNILQRRLESYPSDLDDYFQRMFDRIENVYRMESSRLLLAAMSAEKTLSFWAARCFELEIDSPNYAIDANAPPCPMDAVRIYGCDCAEKMRASCVNGDIQDDEVMHNCYYLLNEDNNFTKSQRAKLKTYLDARCADLLEISRDGITFVHRTARDFLAQSDQLSVNLYDQAGPDYDVFLSLARLTAVDIKRKTVDHEFAIPVMLDGEIFAMEKQIRPSNRLLFEELMKNLGIQQLQSEHGRSGSGGVEPRCAEFYLSHNSRAKRGRPF